jgi:transposase
VTYPNLHARRHAIIPTNTILAVDLGKFKSVCCWYDLATKATTFRTIATSPSELPDAIQRQPNVTVVIEACSPAGWVSDLCESLGVPLLVANTNGEAWAWKNVKRKTDRDDALKLARLCAVGELRTVTVPSRATRQYKSLIGLRKRLVGERVTEEMVRADLAAGASANTDGTLRRLAGVPAARPEA